MDNIKHLFLRILSSYRRNLSTYLYCNIVKLNLLQPLISFSFDDAPHTAFTNGTEIMKMFGARATFYVSLGNLGDDSPSGVIASYDDLHLALDEGHELGCHTFDHINSWEAKPKHFVQSVLRNRQALSNLIPEATFPSLAYPICNPRPLTKRLVGKLFHCCRNGGQTFNFGHIDLNLLKAFFLDRRIGNTVDVVKYLINQNSIFRGWLIFATHDIDDNPSRYGCSKKYFMEVVKYAFNSHALLLPVSEALNIVKKSVIH